MSHVLNERFYGAGDKYNAEASINRHIGERITENDAKLIRSYIAEKQATDHIGEARSRKLAVELVGMRRFLTVPYDQMTTDDVITGIAELKKGRSIRFKRNGELYDGGPLKPTTQRDYIKILKGFIGWLNDTQRTKETVINERRLKNASKIEGAGKTPYKPEDLFTRAEIDAMIEAAVSLRDKTFIAMSFESAARPGETGRLVWGDLQFDEYGVSGKVYDTKAKKDRPVRWVESKHLIMALKESYPGETNGDNFVFIDANGKPLTRIAYVKILERAAKKAGKKMPSILNRKFRKLHNIRHSAGTNYINEGMRVEDLCEVMWGNPATKQVATYVNRSKEAVDTAILKHKGIKKEEEHENNSTITKCRRCGEINSIRNKFCGKCGTPLTKEGIEALRIKQEWFDNQPEILEVKAQLKVLEDTLKKIEGQKDNLLNKN